MNIPLVKSSFYHETATRAALATFVNHTDRFSMSAQCAAYEQAFARVQERRHAVFVSNGSMANLVLIQAMLNLGRLHKGDHVGVSAVTWSTNVMPLIQLGLVPVALDCTLETLNVCSATVAAAEVQAVFLTDVLGFCGDIDRLRDLCAERRIPLLEDACESLGSRYQGTLLGNFGVASTFSFFLGHHLSTIEGGMICTDDDELHSMLVLVRAHGWDRNLEPNVQQTLRAQHHVDDFFAKYTFYDLAYNARPTEINGFLGNVQLPYLAEIIAKRERNFRRFSQALARCTSLCHQLDVSHMETVSNFAMPVVCRSPGILRECIARFQAAGVEIRPLIAGDITQHPFYRKYLAPADCPVAKQVHAQGFYFPNNPELTDKEVDTLCALFPAEA